MLASNRTIRWIENLADQELLINSGERVSIDICSTKEEVLIAETAVFVRELCLHFDNLVGLFNHRVSQNQLQIRLLRQDNDTFLLERNQMRLSVLGAQAGVIQLLCNKLIFEEVSRVPRTSVMFSGLVEAQFGAFHDVEWMFLGSQVTAELVARHYLTEFIQASQSCHRC